MTASKTARLFLLVAGVLLLATAAAKLISSFGGTRILGNSDPITGLAFRNEFRLVGAVELAAALFCFFGKGVKLKAGLVAWLATTFVAYRLDLGWIGYRKPCACLGNLTDALHISPQAADNAMKIVLAYLLLGSCATLFWLWRQNWKAGGRIQNVEFKRKWGLAGVAWDSGDLPVGLDARQRVPTGFMVTMRGFETVEAPHAHKTFASIYGIRGLNRFTANSRFL
jgi:hypothetical protein